MWIGLCDFLIAVETARMVQQQLDFHTANSPIVFLSPFSGSSLTPGNQAGFFKKINKSAIESEYQIM